jgi:RecJ-like exonuclease
MSGFREIELKDPCLYCKGIGYFFDDYKIRALGLRPKDITKDDLTKCPDCKGLGVINTYEENNEKLRSN